MKILLLLILFIAFVSATSPFLLLCKVAWQDRKLPGDHPDYKNIWGKKMVVYVAAAFFGCCSVGLSVVFYLVLTG